MGCGLGVGEGWGVAVGSGALQPPENKIVRAKIANKTRSIRGADICSPLALRYHVLHRLKCKYNLPLCKSQHYDSTNRIPRSANRR